MNVYPLIYSRTKFVGYISSFLVRPADIDYTKAASYVNTAIEDINYTDGIRYTVFSVGEYVIYGGTACYMPRLIEKLNGKLDKIDYQEYQTDNADRPLVFFIGFAIKKSEYSGNVPKIDLFDTYQIYLEYLKKQFFEPNTDTEITKGIELEGIPCISDFTPDCETVGKISLLKNYDAENCKNIINYYFKYIIENPNEDVLFVSDVLIDDVKSSSNYMFLSVADSSVESCITKLRQQQKRNQPVQESNQSVNIQTHISHSPKKQYLVNEPKIKIFNQKKKCSMIIVAIVVILVILLIIQFWPS